jgi:PmbA protein
VAWIDALIAAGRKEVDELEVYYVEGTSVSVSLRKDKVAFSTGARSAGLSVRTIQAGRIGVSSTNNPGQWHECLSAAIASGKLSTPLTWEGLPNPASESYPPINYDPNLAADPMEARQLLEEMLEGAGEHRVQVTSGSADLSLSTTTLANSHGVRYTQPSSHVSLSLEAIAGQSTGYEFEESWANEVHPRKVGERAAFFAEHFQNGGDIGTGDYDLILSPMAAAQLIGAVIVPAINGRNVHAGRSRLAQSLGQAVMDERISLSDDPFDPRGTGSTWWDAEGTPTKRLDFIKCGILEGFAYDLKTAYRYGKQSTASAVRSGFGGAPSIGHHNLILSGKREPGSGKCLYAHDVVGAHTANPLSGDFSVELSNACWMEENEFREPIRKAMIAGNVFDMFRGIGGLGTDDRIIGSMILPSILLNNLHVVGSA